MGVREFIQKQKWLMIPAVCASIAVCGFSSWRSYRSTEMPGMVERAYYSDDDGKSYFAADVKQGYAFEHDGKQAYRAFVYMNASGKPFVGLLARTGAPKKSAAGISLFPNRKADGPPPPVEVKKPGDTKWVSSLSPEYLPLFKSVAPGETPEALLP